MPYAHLARGGLHHAAGVNGVRIECCLSDRVTAITLITLQLVDVDITTIATFPVWQSSVIISYLVPS